MFELLWFLLSAAVVAMPSAEGVAATGHHLNGPKLDGELRAFEAGPVRLWMPAQWEKRAITDAGPLYLAEVSDLLIPRWHDGPVMTTVFLVEHAGESLDAVHDSVVRGYTQNPDRVFASPPPLDKEVVLLASGQKAYLLHLRFFRRSKGLHQSRWDLVIYSAKKKAGYFLTLSVQHTDNTFGIERDLHLPDTAWRFFSGLELQ